MLSRAYDFRPLEARELPIIRRWLANPHVAQWWGNPEQQFALLCGDLGHPAMDQFVVATDGAPFAYLQCYDPAAWPDNGFGPQPHGTRGIDQFIGEPDMIDRGHGSALIRSFIAGLLQGGARRVITDPIPTNVRAIRAYEKAGLQRDRLVETPDGPALLMVLSA
jgi:aminoglycoside 6'-N-acetyltransferase